MTKTYRYAMMFVEDGAQDGRGKGARAMKRLDRRAARKQKHRITREALRVEAMDREDYSHLMGCTGVPGGGIDWSEERDWYKAERRFECEMDAFFDDDWSDFRDDWEEWGTGLEDWEDEDLTDDFYFGIDPEYFFSGASYSNSMYAIHHAADE